MMSSNKVTPSIRFAGFTDTWEQRKLGDIGETYTGLSGKTKEDFGHGDAKFVTYMNVFSNSIADSAMTESVEIDKKQNEVKYGDVFFTTSSETPDEVGMSSVWLENSENTYLNSFCFGYRPSENINPYYMAYMLRSENVRKSIIFLAQGISRYNISKNKMMEISVPLPNLDEQQKIGDYFCNLDDLITLHQRKCDALQKFKRAMLQKMFPQDGESVPEIRFAGFTDAWEQRKLNEVVKSIDTGKSKFRSDSTNGEYAILGSTSIIGYDDCYDYDGDFILTARVGANAGSLYRYAGKAKISDNTVFIQAEKNIEFVYYMLTKFDIKQLSFGTGQPLVKASELKNLELKMPNDIEEQQKIGAYFTQLDTLITLHQRKLETLQKMKKSLLQKMFV